jgi:Tol biopolymer transport system component
MNMLKYKNIIILVIISIITGCKKEKKETASEIQIPPPRILNKILYTALTKYSPLEYQLFTMNSDGTDEKQLTFFNNNDFLYTSEASWSPDGTKIVFVSNKDGRYLAQELYIMNSDGTGVTRLTNNTRRENLPSFSPDGKFILFNADLKLPKQETHQLFLMNADGTGERQLTSFTNGTSVQHTSSGRWSPDGKKIVFMSKKDIEYDFQIYTMNIDGTGVTRLTSSPRLLHLPSYSPDGKKILFVADSRVNPSHRQLYTINSDGTEEKQITFFSSSSQINTTSAHWSPDGNKIVFPTDKDGAGVLLYTINADGTGMTKLNTKSTEIQTPVWR